MWLSETEIHTWAHNNMYILTLCFLETNETWGKNCKWTKLLLSSCSLARMENFHRCWLVGGGLARGRGRGRGRRRQRVTWDCGVAADEGELKPSHHIWGFADSSAKGDCRAVSQKNTALSSARRPWGGLKTHLLLCGRIKLKRVSKWWQLKRTQLTLPQRTLCCEEVLKAVSLTHTFKIANGRTALG